MKGKNALFKYLNYLKKIIGSKEVNDILQTDIDRYFDAAKNIKESEIERELNHCGWLVLIGNDEISTQKAHDVYCKKDVVEKSFNKYKKNLELSRLHVQSDERANNKIFIAFISLILISQIHKVMKEKNIYKRMTMDSLILLVSRIKAVYINGQRITMPLTKEMLALFSDFKMQIPV